MDHLKYVSVVILSLPLLIGITGKDNGVCCFILSDLYKQAVSSGTWYRVMRMKQPPLPWHHFFFTVFQ